MSYLAGLPLMQMDYSYGAPAASSSSLLIPTNNNVNSAVHTITTKQELATFVKSLKSQQKQSPVIVAVTATWCGHCRQFLPSYEQAAAQYQQQSPNSHITFFNLETDSIGLQKLPIPFDNVKGFPTVYKFDKNQIIPLNGARDPASLMKFFNSK
jgi:thioredoxin-like negative regulator of GroEL